MDQTRKEKLKRFMSDRVMAAAVRTAILETYLKPRAKLDVNVLAAERLAINLLDEAWKDMDRYRTDDEQKSDRGGNPGV